MGTEFLGFRFVYEILHREDSVNPYNCPMLAKPFANIVETLCRIRTRAPFWRVCTAYETLCDEGVRATRAGGITWELNYLAMLSFVSLEWW